MSTSETGGPAGTAAMVHAYLGRLAKAAKGLDPAVVHDMLADAERHLVEASNRGVPLARAIDEYGEPSVVAGAYARFSDLGVSSSGRSVAGGGGSGFAAVNPEPAGMPAGMPVSMPAGVAAAAVSARTGLLDRLVRVPIVGVWFDRWAWGSVLFWVVGLVPAIVYFTLITTGVSLSLGLLPMLIGPVVLVGLLGLTRGLALLHGRMIEALVGVRMPRRTAPLAGQFGASGRGTEGWVVRQLSRLWLWLRDGRSWLAMLLLVVNLPVAIAGFTVAVAMLSLGLGLMSTPLAPVVARVSGVPEGTQLMDVGLWTAQVGPGGVVMMPWIGFVLGPILGFMLLTGALWVCKGGGFLYAQGVKSIQVSRPVFDQAV